MKKIIIAFFFIILLISSSLSTLSGLELSNHETIFLDKLIVDNEGDGDYKNIQNAISNAKPGDIIEVYSGTYYEHIIIDKPIFLIGIAFEFDINPALEPY